MSSIVERTHRAAVQMWEACGSRGPRPKREDFAHLEELPEKAAEPPNTDVADAAAERVKQALVAMQQDARTTR